jgi:hypothetical protein
MPRYERFSDNPTPEPSTKGSEELLETILPEANPGQFSTNTPEDAAALDADEIGVALSDQQLMDAVLSAKQMVADARTPIEKKIADRRLEVALSEMRQGRIRTGQEIRSSQFDPGP